MVFGSFREGRQPPLQFLEDIPEQFRDRFGDRFGGGGFGGGQQSALTTWVTQHCTVVPASQWQSTASNTQNAPGPLGANQLYDCVTAH